LGLVPTLYSTRVASEAYSRLKKKKKNIVKLGVASIVGATFANELNDFVNSV